MHFLYIYLNWPNFILYVSILLFNFVLCHKLPVHRENNNTHKIKIR